ncbi:peroxiredoxin [Aeromicrobium sp. Root236]|uniref:OsmC family peroxiredoxin n=1 Tax=Aeromicrobium sp. Root236 TaxID=1736498 RepID=UPI0006FE8B2C|nr:OsmC family peroxiredoxin [Aeromicrobium sp. Root236]KRC64435.1 peroxiredoxin [Aeromicrobium sp. Root236]
MPTRTARTAWDGGLQDGSGQVELTSSGLGTFEVSFPQRASEDGGGVTNPEELIGAAHSACYAMSLAGQLGARDATPLSMEIRADVTLGPDPEGGFKITGITLTVRGEADGIDEAGFLEAAEAAKVGCPVSKALAGVDITLDAAMETP